MTTIGVVGYGVVGEAVTKGFKKRGFKVLVNEVQSENKPKISQSKGLLLKWCDFIFICVGTPPTSDGRMNDGYLIHTLNEFSDIDKANPREELPIFVIKSTILPGTAKALEEAYPRFRFAVNPEFLTQKHAERDFLNPDRIIVGASDDRVAFEVLHLYDSWSCARCVTSPIAAELIKHLSNAYLLTKIAFACEMQRLCQHYFIDDMDAVYKGVTSDHRIDKSHLNPLFGRIPFDSPCLPKDLLALIKALKDDGVDTSYLQGVFDGGVQL